MVDFSKDPQYQEAIQRIMSMSPEQKAVLDTAIVDRRFASEDMRRRLEGMRAEARRLANERGLGLKRRQFETRKRELPRLERIGYAEVGVSGLLGLGSLMRGRRQVQSLEQEREVNTAILRKLRGMGG